MKWISMLYTGAATPVHAMMGILGVCIVTFSFAGALGGFMEKFTYAVFFLYGIFLFYCAFFSRLLVEANRLEGDDPKRGNLIGLSYVYQGVLIPVILVMTWWILSTFIGKANNLVITAKSISEPLIREFEHMTRGPIEYDVDDLKEGEGVITLKLFDTLTLNKPLNSMIEYDGEGAANLFISVSEEVGGLPGYEIFIEENPIRLTLDTSNATSDERPYRDACYIRIPVLKPDVSSIPADETSIYAYHDITLNLLRKVTLVSDNGIDSNDLLIGNGFVMVKYEDHRAYAPSGRVIYCPGSLEKNGKEYLSVSLGNSIPVKINAEFIYPVISKELISYARENRPYFRSWRRYQKFLKWGFEDLID
ncbi:hypothetical protein A9Q99_24120 [Gammaproteobacteria bacterium 45_16_T64]|nr:hypothetical protein A9Q99_24120 [Gammaproteobacteria bacterium 45_16_T64]